MLPVHQVGTVNDSTSALCRTFPHCDIEIHINRFALLLDLQVVGRNPLGIGIRRKRTCNT